jgi:hypothetical protein
MLLTEMAAFAGAGTGLAAGAAAGGVAGAAAGATSAFFPFAVFAAFAGAASTALIVAPHFEQNLELSFNWAPH